MSCERVRETHERPDDASFPARREITSSHYSTCSTPDLVHRLREHRPHVLIREPRVVHLVIVLAAAPLGPAPLVEDAQALMWQKELTFDSDEIGTELTSRRFMKEKAQYGNRRKDLGTGLLAWPQHVCPAKMTDLKFDIWAGAFFWCRKFLEIF